MRARVEVAVVAEEQDHPLLPCDESSISTVSLSIILCAL